MSRDNSQGDKNNPRDPRPGTSGGSRRDEPIPDDRYHPSVNRTPGNVESGEDNGWQVDTGNQNNQPDTNEPDWW